jgi:hypothetical protein
MLVMMMGLPHVWFPITLLSGDSVFTALLQNYFIVDFVNELYLPPLLLAHLAGQTRIRMPMPALQFFGTLECSSW